MLSAVTLLKPHPFVIEWEENNEKQVDKITIHKVTKQVFYSLLPYCDPALINSLMYGMSSTSVQLDHSWEMWHQVFVSAA